MLMSIQVRTESLAGGRIPQGDRPESAQGQDLAVGTKLHGYSGNPSGWNPPDFLPGVHRHEGNRAGRPCGEDFPTRRKTQTVEIAWKIEQQLSRGNSPDAEAEWVSDSIPVAKGGGQMLPIGGQRQRVDPLLVRVGLPLVQFPAAGRFPQAERDDLLLVHDPGDEGFSIRSQGHSVEVGTGRRCNPANHFLSPHIPDMHDVLLSTSQPPTVVAEGDRVNRLARAPKLADPVPGCHLPHPDGIQPSANRCGQGLAVRCEGHRGMIQRCSFLPSEGAEFLAGRSVMKDEAPAGSRRSDRLAVRRKSDGPNTLSMAEADGPQPRRCVRRQRVAMQVEVLGPGGPDGWRWSLLGCLRRGLRMTRPWPEGQRRARQQRGRIQDRFHPAHFSQPLAYCPPLEEPSGPGHWPPGQACQGSLRVVRHAGPEAPWASRFRTCWASELPTRSN